MISAATGAMALLMVTLVKSMVLNICWPPRCYVAYLILAGYLKLGSDAFHARWSPASSMHWRS
jgi:MFS superfamily sulfate permease-like transporter